MSPRADLMGGICIIAGEASGDVQGAHLVRSLKSELAQRGLDDLPFWGAAGPCLRDEGVVPVVATENLAAMGLVEVVRSYVRISDAYHGLLRGIERWHPIAVILIDYPGFNLSFAREAFVRGRLVFYHIPPKVWAHGFSRVRRLAEFTHLVTCILPFEEALLRRSGVDAAFVGNPLRDAVEAFCAATPRDADDGYLHIGLLPGSRRMEIVSLVPRLVAAFVLLQQELQRPIRAHLPIAATLDHTWVRQQVVDAARLVGRDEAWVSETISFCCEGAYPVLRRVDYAWVCSGTVALEAAFFGVPMCVVYYVHPLTWAIGRCIVDLQWVSLGNLAVQKTVIPEYLQGEATPGNLVAHAKSILLESQAGAAMRQGLQEVRDCFPCGALHRAAKVMAKTVDRYSLPEAERFQLHRCLLRERLRSGEGA